MGRTWLGFKEYFGKKNLIRLGLFFVPFGLVYLAEKKLVPQDWTFWVYFGKMGVLSFNGNFHVYQKDHHKENIKLLAHQKLC